MRYMLMLYADEKAGAQIAPADIKKALSALYAYRDSLAKAGGFVATAPLARTWEARTLRMEGGDVEKDAEGMFVNSGELRVHNGPYADTREQLGGYFIIEASSMDDAVQWAALCPAAQWGSIEVRPFADL